MMEWKCNKENNIEYACDDGECNDEHGKWWMKDDTKSDPNLCTHNCQDFHWFAKAFQINFDRKCD